ncbi:hypothetical protein [Arthrobacter zhaoguopingii]|uniref:hypothetical protein n=1 Tax=Arthrobacter zhaoguopingii TaxID=2681491 RepID=UPI001358703E|nr:hypothetical protein [Arthrobacter zhaoguopingii]
MLSNRLLVLLLTTVAPCIWGTTYFVASELLPPERPLLAAVLRSLPAGLLLLLVVRRRPRGRWWWRSAVLGAWNIGVFFALVFIAPGASGERSAESVTRLPHGNDEIR